MDAGAQLAAHKVQNHLRQMAVAKVAGTDNPGGMYDAGIQDSVLGQAQHLAGDFRLGLGILSDHPVGMKILGFGNQLLTGLFRDGMHTADVYQPRMMAKRLLDDMARARDVHGADGRVMPRFDGYQRRAVDDVQRRAVLYVKERLQGIGLGHIAVKEGAAHAVQRFGTVPGQHQRPDFVVFGLRELADDGIAQKAVGACDDVGLFHSGVTPVFRQFAAVLHGDSVRALLQYAFGQAPDVTRSGRCRPLPQFVL